MGKKKLQNKVQKNNDGVQGPASDNIEPVVDARIENPVSDASLEDSKQVLDDQKDGDKANGNEQTNKSKIATFGADSSQVESKSNQETDTGASDEAKEKNGTPIENGNGENVEPDEDSLFKDEQISQLTSERDAIQTQYNTLLSKLSGMKAVFQEMQSSKQELVVLRDQLHEYETQNLALKNKTSTLNTERNLLKNETQEFKTNNEKLKRDLRDKDDIIQSLKTQLSKVEESTERELEAMKIIKKDLLDRNEELRLLLENTKKDNELIVSEKEDLQVQIEEAEASRASLKHDAELLEKQNIEMSDKYMDLEKEKTTVEGNLKSKISELQTEMLEKDTLIAKYQSELQGLNKLSELKAQYEEESKNKSLQIGKLRHEAIILNEHLTKALSMLKRSSDSDNVDKELISNLFISFVSIPRGDNKKFEVLELIANFLNWDIDQKTQAGLIHGSSTLSSLATQPGASNASNTKSGKVSKTESFVSMWTDFLQKESGE